MAGEPGKPGLLAEIGILRKGIFGEGPLRDVPVPCPLGTVILAARQVERLGREVEEAAQEKDTVDGVDSGF